MTDVDPLSDMDSMVDEVMSGIESRGIRALHAAYADDVSVSLFAPSVDIQEVLDLIAATRPPFVTVDVSRFDPTLFGTDEEDQTAALLRVASDYAQHDGEVDHLLLKWFDRGALYAWSAMPQWRIDLHEKQDLASEDITLLEQMERREMHGKIAALASRIEADPDYRRGTLHSRRAIAERLATEWGVDRNTIPVFMAIRQASALVREHSEATYAALTSDLKLLATELAVQDVWRSAYRASDRTAAVTDFLLEHADGYSPNGALIREFRNLVEAIRRP